MSARWAPYRDVTTVGRRIQLWKPARFTDRSFDLFISMATIIRLRQVDAVLGAEMVKETGFLVFNDYMLIDHNHANYGIVPVSNDMVVNHGWRVAGYAPRPGPLLRHRPAAQPPRSRAVPGQGAVAPQAASRGSAPRRAGHARA